MQENIENKKRLEEKYMQSKIFYGTGTSLGLGSEIDEKKPYNERSKTTLRYRKTSAGSMFLDEDEEEYLREKIMELENKLRRAEMQKKAKLNNSVDRVTSASEKLKMKRLLKEQYMQAEEFETLKKAVDKRMLQTKKEKKKLEELKEFKES